jgi:hypothetical protein
VRPFARSLRFDRTLSSSVLLGAVSTLRGGLFRPDGPDWVLFTVAAVRLEYPESLAPSTSGSNADFRSGLERAAATLATWRVSGTMIWASSSNSSQKAA